MGWDICKVGYAKRGSQAGQIQFWRGQVGNSWLGYLEALVALCRIGLPSISAPAPRHLSLFIIFIIAVLMILEFGSQILCEMIGFLYPTYMSFKAIESHKVDDDQ